MPAEANPSETRLAEVFAAALEKQDAELRQRFLDESCGGEPGLHSRVGALLRAHERADKFLDRNAHGEDMDLNDEGAGTIIGSYRLVERLGVGGFGVVYRAEQTKPIRREVALKIIKLGMDTRAVVARFEAERQALALMDHANIAKVFDAGATETGRPYFVMELVPGPRITDYCDQHRLSTPERLALFMQVCHAIQHAHQKGIIHRDLKPSNILVTMQDGVAVPKVIDFGIAKATSGQVLTDKTVYTAVDQFLGTPAYTSPEQAQVGRVDIDTRSDIYNLGVLLYELLTGHTPFEPKQLVAAGIDEMRRIIREQEPPRPSTRLSTLADPEQTTVAQRRRSEPPQLIHQIRGDLDWIVMKCLEKDRQRRYATANDLAIDVAHFLRNEPVVARHPSRFYRIRKFACRNRLAFTAGTTALTAISVALLVSICALLRTRDARRQAQSDFRTAFGAVGQITELARELGEQPQTEQFRRGLLQRALTYYEEFIQRHADDPAVRHELAQACLLLADIYQMRGEYEASLPPLGRALNILTELRHGDPRAAIYPEEMVQCVRGMATAAGSLGRLLDCVEPRRKELLLCEELYRQFPNVAAYSLAVASAHMNVANALGVSGFGKERLAEALEAFALYQKYRADYPASPEDPLYGAAWFHHWLGAALEAHGRLDEALQHYRQAEAVRQDLLNRSPQNLDCAQGLAHVKSYVAGVLGKTGRPEEAEGLLKQAIAMHESILLKHPTRFESQRRRGWNYFGLGCLLWPQHRLSEAEAAFRQAVQIFTNLTEVRGRNEELWGLAQSQLLLGQLFDSAGRSTEAAQLFHDAFATFDILIAQNPVSPTHICRVARVLATVPIEQYRDPARAATLVQRAMQTAPVSGEMWEVLGISQYRLSEFSDAIQSLLRARELSGKDAAVPLLYLAMAYKGQGDEQRAQQSYEQANAAMQKSPAADGSLKRVSQEAQALLSPAPVDRPRLQ